MAEDEVKKTGGQVDGKGLAHFISSIPFQLGELMRRVFPRFDSNQKRDLQIMLMQADDLVFLTILFLLFCDQLFFYF